MDHDRIKLELKIGLVAIVVRDLGVKSIWEDFSFSDTLRHEQARRTKFSHNRWILG